MAKTPEEIRELNLAAQEFLSTVASMSANLNTLAKDIEQDTGEAQARSIITRREFVDIAEKLKRYSKEDLADKRKANAFQRSLSDAKSKQAALEAEINELLERGGENLENLTKEEKKKLEVLTDAEERYKGIVGEAEKLKDELKRIDDEVSLFDDINEFGKQIPGLSVMFGEFENASKAARKAAKDGGNALAAGAAQLTGAVGKLLLAFSVKTFLGGISKGQERITQFSRELNISREQANQLNLEFARIGRETVGLTAENLIEGMLEVSNQLGISAQLTKEQAVAFGTLTSKLGLTAEQAGKLTILTAASGQELTKFNTTLIGTVLEQNAATDSAVRYQDVLKDIASAGAATQLTVSKFPGGLAQAAFQARRFGLNMMALEKTADSLLNFESSIEAELEAELLTGRELNLERARAAALMGDQATLSAELAKNFGTAQEFQNQSVIAQEAQAQAMGMTRHEMAETLLRQEAMKELNMDMSKGFKEQVIEKRKQIQQLREEGKIAEANRLERNLFNAIGEDEFGRQQQNLSLMETQKELLEDIRDAAQIIAKPFDSISKLLQGIGTSAFEFLGFITKAGSKLKALGAVFGEALAKNMDSIGKGVKNFFPNLVKMMKVGAKGSTMLLKKIPVVGALVGLGLAIKRMSEGDVIGGLLELGSGVASLFPGIGTGVSLGIDAGLMGLDAAGITGEKSQTVQGSIGAVALTSGMSTMSAGGGLANIIAMNNLQSAIEKSAKAAEGTKEAVEKLAEKESIINIDGNRAGRAMVVGSYKHN